MVELRIRMKIADSEFEAEGQSDIVRAELAAFKRLLPAEIRAALPPESGTAAPPSRIGEIVRAKGRVVSLKSSLESLEHAVLVVLLGQKQYRGNERVTGAEITDGLRASGQRVTRVDYLLSRLAANGIVTATGKGRSRRYRLTNPGLQKAQDIVQRLAASAQQGKGK